MEWVRRWQYELTWEPGHTGVLSRYVDTLEQVRAVVEWARANPHIHKCSYRPHDELVGDQVATCNQGHLLEVRQWGQSRASRSMRMVKCRDCPGHYETTCPTCEVRVYDPAPGPDCGPVVDG